MSLQDLTRRIGRPERDNRRLKLANGAVVAVLLDVALVGGAMPRAIPDIGGASSLALVAQESGRTVERTEEGLYLLTVVEPGYDLTVREIERSAKSSVLEMSGLVPTVTAGGVVMFRAMYDIAREREFEYTFSIPQSRGQTSRGTEGRRVSLVTRLFVTNDADTRLEELLGDYYTEEAQQMFDRRGYQSVAQLATLFGDGGV